MGLRDCLISAADQGAISAREAAELADDFDQRFAQLKNGMSEDMAKAKARKELEAALRAQAAEKRRRADLTEARRLGVKSFVRDYRNRDGQPDVFEAAMALLSHYGFRGASSVRGRTEAIVAGAHKNLDEVMFSFERRGVLGKRANLALASDMVKEVSGEASGDATAKSLAGSVSAVFEDLRQRFNAAGGAIGKLENFGLPHSHDRARIRAAGLDAWKTSIRNRLDPARMKDPLTGQPLDAARLDRALDHSYASIVSENRAHMQPQMLRAGRGALASQRQDERFLVFKSAQDWLDYNAEFGRGDPVQAIFNHINGMARDIAAMEVLGPNPAAMVEYLKNIVSHEIGKNEAGMPSLAKDPKFLKMSAAKYATWRLDSLYQTLRGTPSVVAGAAEATTSIKNVLTGVQLGSTVILAAATDPFIARAGRMLAGLPVSKQIGSMIGQLSRQTRREQIRSGIMWGEYMHVMQDELRFAGPMLGAEWSRWIADRGLTWSGLAPMTTARQLLEGRAWQAAIADFSGKRFDQLDKRLRTGLQGFGVDSAIWEIWRKGVDPAGFVTSRQIEANGGAVRYLDMKAALPADMMAEDKALAHRAAAEKLSEVIHSWRERSVPSGTPNARSAVTGAVQRGTLAGEFVDFMLQYKSFGLSFTAMQLEAMAEMSAARGGGKGKRTGLGYFAALAIPVTLGGAAYLQIKALLDGREPEDMNPVENPGFWVKAGMQGGGFGLFGDFVKATENRFGQTMVESLAGPGVALINDVGKFTIGNALDVATGQDTKAGREAVDLARRYTPILSSNWATRGAYNRVVLDNLQWMLDPAADKSFKAKARAAKKNGTPFWFPPGALTPAN